MNSMLGTKASDKSKAPASTVTKSTLGQGAKTTGIGGGFLGKPKEAQKVELPDDLKGKTVGKVLEEFETNLEEQVKEFQKQARQIARWDREIFECIALMQHLEQQIKTVEGAQKELQQTAYSLLQDQEAFIEELKKEASENQLPESGDQRQRLYTLAHDLSNKFCQMEDSLKSIVNSDNDSNADSSTSDVGKIEQIANCHLDAMRWIEHQSNALEEKINALSIKLHSIQ